jgi:hypothetical protein
VRRLLFVLFLAAACSKVEPVDGIPVPSYTVGMELREDQKGGTVRFDTGTFRGTIEIGPGLTIGYKSVTQTSSAGSSSKTTLTLDGREMIIEKAQLRVGDRVIGPLSGDVKIDVTKDGVFVDGVKKSEL